MTGAEASNLPDQAATEDPSLAEAAKALLVRSGLAVPIDTARDVAGHLVPRPPVAGTGREASVPSLHAIQPSPDTPPPAVASQFPHRPRDRPPSGRPDMNIARDASSQELRVLILEDQAADAELCERELRRAGLRFVARRVA